LFPVVVLLLTFGNAPGPRRRGRRRRSRGGDRRQLLLFGTLPPAVALGAPVAHFVRLRALGLARLDVLLGTLAAIGVAVVLPDLLRGHLRQDAERALVGAAAGSLAGLSLGLATPPALSPSAFPETFAWAALAAVTAASVAACAAAWAASRVAGSLGAALAHRRPPAVVHVCQALALLASLGAGLQALAVAP